MKDRDKIIGSSGADPYHVVSDYWVAHGEIDLLIIHPGSLQIGNRRLLFVEIVSATGFRSWSLIAFGSGVYEEGSRGTSASSGAIVDSTVQAVHVFAGQGRSLKASALPLVHLAD